jgi:hypothetical protein
VKELPDRRVPAENVAMPCAKAKEQERSKQTQPRDDWREPSEETPERKPPTAEPRSSRRRGANERRILTTRNHV